MVIKVITYSNVLFINILLFILDCRPRRVHTLIFYVLILIITSHLVIYILAILKYFYHTVSYETMFIGLSTML